MAASIIIAILSAIILDIVIVITVAFIIVAPLVAIIIVPLIVIIASTTLIYTIVCVRGSGSWDQRLCRMPLENGALRARVEQTWTTTARMAEGEDGEVGI